MFFPNINPLTISALALATGALTGPVTPREADADPFRYRLPRAHRLESPNVHALYLQQRSSAAQSPEDLQMDDMGSEYLRSSVAEPGFVEEFGEQDPFEPSPSFDTSTSPVRSTSPPIEPNLEFLCIQGSGHPPVTSESVPEELYERQSLPTSPEDVDPTSASDLMPPQPITYSTESSVGRTEGITPNIQLECVQLYHDKNQSTILRSKKQYQA